MLNLNFKKFTSETEKYPLKWIINSLISKRIYMTAKSENQNPLLFSVMSWGITASLSAVNG